jgi:hypothetical protein
MATIDFAEIPVWWPVCTNRECPMAEDCLRQKVCREAPENVTSWACVLPNALKDGCCKYYQKAEVVRMARGLNAIYKNVHSREARHGIRIDLTGHYGSKGAYYRYKDGERWLNPKEQQIVANIVRSYGCQGEVNFDEYREGYDFTVLP